MRTQSGIILLDDIFASEGDKQKPGAFPLKTGWPLVYQQSERPKRETFNYLYNALYSLGYDVNRQGALLDWDATVVYALNAAVRGSDGNLYQSNVNDNTNQDPVTDDGTNWILLSQVFSDRSYEASSASNAVILNTATGPALKRYYDGLKVEFKSDIANTGATTLNIDGIGIKNIVDFTGNALSTGAIITGRYYSVIYDFSNDNFVLNESDVVLESDIVDNLLSTDPKKVLSAKQGNLLAQRVTVSAWATFDGTGTPSIIDSFGVSSIIRSTDPRAGRYAVTWDTPFANTAYFLSGTTNGASTTSTNPYEQQCGVYIDNALGVTSTVANIAVGIGDVNNNLWKPFDCSRISILAVGTV